MPARLPVLATLHLAALALAALAAGPAAAAGGYTNFETVPLRPLALSPRRLQRLFAVNTPDARLEIFAVRRSAA